MTETEFFLLELPTPWCLQCEQPMTVVSEHRDFARRRITLRVWCHGTVETRVHSLKERG